MKKLFGRLLILIPALFLQLFIYSFLFGWIFNYSEIVLGIIGVLSVIFILYLLGKRMETNYKISWIVIILTAPVFGTLLYFFFGNKSSSRKLKRKIEDSKKRLNYKFKNDLCPDDGSRETRFFNQIEKLTGNVPYLNTESTYFKSGEEFFQDILKELKRAKRFIFVEFFIIKRGKLFDEFIDILIEKVKEGVDVRFMYDDFGSINKFSLLELKRMKDEGIKCLLFNPVSYFDARLNNRDHRKMVVIDGKISYSGGNNLSDEYANIISPFGYWKDIGFKLQGKAVEAYSYMFIEFWNAFSKDLISDKLLDVEYSSYKTKNGIIASYYDAPFYEDAVTNSIYVDMLSSAKSYFWIYTPYLILPNSLNDALIRAAKRGVDVRIILPGIPDKKIVYRFSKSYCPDLLDAGARIYTYDPGFVHAKAVLSDDEICAIGTVNFDFRSLYLHFENNTIFYKSSIISDLKRDMIESMNQSSELLSEDLNSNIIKKIVDSLFRVIAPLF